MRRLFTAGIFNSEGLLIALFLIIATIQVTCANNNNNDNNSSNKENRVKSLYGLLKDYADASKNKKATHVGLLEDEGLRFKKGSSLLDEEGLRFKKASYLEDEGMRFKKMPTDHFDRNAIIRKSVLDGEGLRFKKGSSLLDDEGMRFRRSHDGGAKEYSGQQEEGDFSKRYFPGKLFFFPFNMDQLYTSYERRSDRSGNRDILEGEGMRF